MARAQSEEIALLRTQIEMLIAERESLLRTVGAASVLVANMSADDFPEEAYGAAELLAASLDGLTEETLSEALTKVRPELEDDEED